MTETTLDLIRHGQSEGNVREVFLGHSDWDLTPLGFLQADLCAKHLKDVPYSAVYASDLCRAVHTANPTAQTHGLPVRTSPCLREIYAGEWEGKSFDALEKEYPDSFCRWREDPFAVTPDGGEDPRKVTRRVMSFLSDLAEKHAGERIAVFTHATAIRAFCAEITQTSPRKFPWAGNASVTAVCYKNGAFSLLSYGDNAYLAEYQTTFSK